MNLDLFIEETKKIGIELTSQQLEKLNQFYELLISWNQKMNLTRIIEKEDVYLKHFYDSLTLSKVIDLKQDLTLCDVGSGAGFPGIVLKICFPNLKITLLDSLQKRVNYLNEIIKELDLKNIEAIHTRAEDYAKQNREKFDIAVSRAVARLNVLCEYCLPYVKVGGLFVAMKGPNADEELDGAENALKLLGGKVEKVHKFNLPCDEGERTIIVIKKVKPTPKQYPRISGKIKSQPL